MNYRRLGRTGLKLSVICLGTMQFGWSVDEPTSQAIMTKAVEMGCNFFDTADLYSRWAANNPGGVSEQLIGNWLKQGVVPRQDLIIATKVRGTMGNDPNQQGLSRHHILNGVKASLKRLQTDYIDLYQVHWPDEETPLDETLTALNDLVRSGLVRYIGCSNYPAWLLMKALWLSDVGHLARFDSLQPHYHLLHRAEFERELQAVCLDQGLGVVAYSPLGGGFLTGKYRPGQPLPNSPRANRIEQRYMNEKGFALLDCLAEISSAHQISIAQTAIAWVLANPAMTAAIIGANSVEQLQETMGGANVTLTGEEKLALDQWTEWKGI